jgi:hypothetical protein
MIIEKCLKSLLVLIGLALVFERSTPAQAWPSMAPRAGNLLSYMERPVAGVDDRNFNRFWGDRLNFVDWTAVKPARIFSATFALPDGRKLTATMLSDRDDCDVDACPRLPGAAGPVFVALGRPREGSQTTMRARPCPISVRIRGWSYSTSSDLRCKKDRRG